MNTSVYVTPKGNKVEVVCVNKSGVLVEDLETGKIEEYQMSDLSEYKFIDKGVID